MFCLILCEENLWAIIVLNQLFYSFCQAERFSRDTTNTAQVLLEACPFLIACLQGQGDDASLPAGIRYAIAA